MQERYRRDYDGEFVISNTTWKDGKKEQQREWIDNPIKVVQESGKATCIAESPAFKDTFYRRVADNRGDLLARNRMQTYGIEGVWKYMRPNFLVSQTKENLGALAEDNDYTENVIVYTSAANCMRYPGSFFLIPYNVMMHANAQAAWLACFDEHTEVYLVGYQIIRDGKEDSKLVNAVGTVMDAYKNVTFYHVTSGQNPPDLWRRKLNVKQMDFQEYVSICDV